jgi:acylphosphatase
VLAEGPEPALSELLSWLRQGPRAARVDDTRPSWGTASGDYREFRIAF